MTFTTKMRLFLMISTLVVSVLLSNCQGENQSASRGKPINIGVVVSQTGWASPIGMHMQKGAQLAAEQVNKQGGINGVPINLIVEDWKSSNTDAATAAQKLIEINEVKTILGQWTGDVQSYVAVSDAHNVTVICMGCGAPNFTAQSPHLFRVWPSDELEVKEVIHYAREKGIVNPAVMYTIDPWSKGLRDSFVRNWGEEVPSIGVQPNQKDFRTELLKLKDLHVDLIYLLMVITDEGFAIKQAREMNISAQFVSTTSTPDPSMLAIAGRTAEGVVFPQYTPSNNEFIQSYTLKYGEPPGVYADAAYDAVMVLATALRNNPSDIEGELGRTKNFPGASGSITIDKTRDRVSRDLRLMTIKDGKAVPLIPPPFLFS